MKPHSRVHHGVAPAWPEQMLEEIIRQLPLGLICTDLEGETLFMNATAKDTLEVDPLTQEYEKHEHQERLPSLPPEIRRGIECLRDLLTQDARTYARPFPKFYFQGWGGYDLEFFLYCSSEELCRETRKQARIIVLLKSPKPTLPSREVARRFSLTTRESEVLQYLIEGKARKEIAAAMNLSEDTVRSYLRSLYEKLGVTSRVEAATLGLRLALLENLQSVLHIQK
jgi:DNA-binding CsgD family transcriptional regulator